MWCKRYGKVLVLTNVYCYHVRRLFVPLLQLQSALHQRIATCARVDDEAETMSRPVHSKHRDSGSFEMRLKIGCCKSFL
jgi:hypothetical protein